MPIKLGPAAPSRQNNIGVCIHKGCPVEAGRDWTCAELEAAIEYSSQPMDGEARKQLCEETYEKEKRGMVEILKWSDLKTLPEDEFPKKLKASHLFGVPHKSWNWRAILDLSWILQMLGYDLDSVNNDSSTKTAPRGAIDQSDHALLRIIQMVATAP